MAHTGVPYLIPITLRAGGTLAVADDQDVLVMDFDAIVWRVHATIQTTGDTSGSTTFVVENTRSSTATDMWTIASDAGTIAYNASALYQDFDWENDAWTGYSSSQIYPPSGCHLSKGDSLSLCINAIPGGTSSTNLAVTLWVKPKVD